MKMTQVSTASIANSTREARINLQQKLAEGQKEATTGRLADVGESLGYLSERAVSLRQDRDRLTTFKEANSIASNRLSLTQTSLEGLADSAQDFLNTLVAARSTRSGQRVAISDAGEKLKSFTAVMNSASNGAYLFAGVNTDIKPIADYRTDPPSASQTAVASAFSSEFGVAQGAAGTEAVSGAAMKSFLDGGFSALFDGSNWSTTWSTASDQNIQSRIADNERIVTSASANEKPFRDLASVYTMVADIGLDTLNEEAYATVLDTAIARLGQAIGDVTQVRANLGGNEERIKSQNERMDFKIKIIDDHVTALEGVDPYEAAANVNALLTQVETAYSLTARLQNLSLLKYL